MPKEQPVVEYYEKYTQNTFYFKASYFKRIETKTKIKIKLKLQNLAHTSASCRLIGKTHLLLGIPAIDYNVFFAPFFILCKEISQGLAARASTQGGMQEPCAPATGGFEGSRTPHPHALCLPFFPPNICSRPSTSSALQEEDRPQGKFKNILKGHLVPFSYCLN